MELCFELDPTRANTAFELKLTDLVMRQSKVKIVAWDWLSPFGLDLLNPWSIFTRGPKGIPRDNDVDVTALVSIQAVWLAGQKVHVEEIAAADLPSGSEARGIGRRIFLSSQPAAVPATDLERAPSPPQHLRESLPQRSSHQTGPREMGNGELHRHDPRHRRRRVRRAGAGARVTTRGSAAGTDRFYLWRPAVTPGVARVAG